MKRICVPLTARPHFARLKLFIEELKKYFEVDIFQPIKSGKGMSISAILMSVEFNNFLSNKNYDAVIIRGDRYEMLGLAMCSLYNNIKIIHIEGGDLSGVIDNKIRHAITQLADYHFVTNEQSFKNLVNMGASIARIWNFGSLDVEFANKVKSKKIIKEPYILVAYHGIENEDINEIEIALKSFNKYRIIRIKGNNDYDKSFGNEEYPPEDYINMIRYASCYVGNSSSLIKEASILGVSSVNIGDRQQNRLKPSNILDVPCKARKIELGIEYQLKNKSIKDYTYYKKNTSINIVKKLKQIL